MKCTTLLHVTVPRADPIRLVVCDPHFYLVNIRLLQNAIDLDLRDIKSLLSVGTRSAAEAAERIYREGAHCRPVALITLDNPLSQDVPKGAEVTGLARSSQGVVVTGHAKEAWKQGDKIVAIEYAISLDQSNVSWFHSGSIVFVRLKLFFSDIHGARDICQ